MDKVLRVKQNIFLTFLVRKPLLSVLMMLNRACTSSNLISFLSILPTCTHTAAENIHFKITLNYFKSIGFFSSVSSMLKIFSIFYSENHFCQTEGVTAIHINNFKQFLKIIHVFDLANLS
jgi:hypothetical protein